MTIEFRYASMVNSVVKLQMGTHARVRKEYGEVAAKTGVPVPLDRKFIEERILNILGRDQFSGFKVPVVIDKGERYLEFGVLEGSLAIDVIAEEIKRNQAERWHSIGAGLAQAESYLQAHAGEIFNGLLSTQRQCAKIMREIKYKELSVAEEGGLGFVSLGDVGVRNIMLGESDTYLFDFEFAHFSRRARDAGQLTSQLISLGASTLANSVKFGYLGVTPGAAEDLHFWISAFANYYGKKYGKN